MQSLAEIPGAELAGAVAVWIDHLFDVQRLGIEVKDLAAEPSEDVLF